MPLATPPKIGESIGAFLVRGLLGTSGMGPVYLVLGGAPRRELALALLDERFHDDAPARERFFGWARALRGSKHPNLVEIVDVVEQGSRQCVVTELLRGRSLAELLKDGPLPLPRAMHVAWQISQAVAAAHDVGVIHGGLKLASVFVTIHAGARDAVKVLDFMSSEASAALAPEQQAGGATDHRVDIYAFGVLLFELATGRPPFVAETMQALRRAHQEQVPPPPSSIREVPATLDALVQRCLAKDPDERPDMMREVQESLREVALLVTSHQPEPAMDPTGDFALPAVGGWTIVPAPLVRQTRPAPIPGISSEGDAVAEAAPVPPMAPLMLDPAAADDDDLPSAEPDDELPLVAAEETTEAAAPAPAAPAAALLELTIGADGRSTDAADLSTDAADLSTDAAMLPRVELGIAAPARASLPRGRRAALLVAGVAIAAIAVVGVRWALAPASTSEATPPPADPPPEPPSAPSPPPEPPPEPPPGPPSVQEPAAVVAPPTAKEPAAKTPPTKPPVAARRPKVPTAPAAEAPVDKPAAAEPPADKPKDEGTLKDGALVNPFKKKPK